MKKPDSQKASWRRGYEDGLAVRGASPHGFDETLYRKGYEEGIIQANHSLRFESKFSFRD